MTTAPFSWLRLRDLPCVPSAVRDDARYVGDHVIRHYVERSAVELLADLDLPPDTSDLVIAGGIGRLQIRLGAMTWEPVVRTVPSHPAPRPADIVTMARRRAACVACDAYRDARCTAAGCGCTGLGHPEIWSSRCPLGKWHDATMPISLRSQQRVPIRSGD